MSGIEIDDIGGNCPVQAEGRIDGKVFYFRARGNTWGIGIGGDPLADPEWACSGPFGDGPFEAGWMSKAEARGLIEKAAMLYRQHCARVSEMKAAPQ